MKYSVSQFNQYMLGGLVAIENVPEFVRASLPDMTDKYLSEAIAVLKEANEQPAGAASDAMQKFIRSTLAGPSYPASEVSAIADYIDQFAAAHAGACGKLVQPGTPLSISRLIKFYSYATLYAIIACRMHRVAWASTLAARAVTGSLDGWVKSARWSKYEAFAFLTLEAKKRGLNVAAAAPATSTEDEDDTTMPTKTATATATAAAIEVADQFKPIINSVLANAGVRVQIEELVTAYSEVDALRGVANELTNSSAKLTEAKQRADEEVRLAKEEMAELMRRLQQAQRAAANAAPTSLTVPASTGGALPSGKMEMVPAGDVFPVLKNVNLMVPKFTWDAPHPDVPELIDDYLFRPVSLVPLLLWMKNGTENPWLVGHTGTGKTTLVEQIASRLGFPVMRISFDSAIERAELVGKQELKGDGKGGTDSAWISGALERSMPNNYIILFDEQDCARPDAVYILQPLLERKGLLLLEDGARRVHFGPYTRVAATGNTAGNGDESGLYPACRILPAATLDRYGPFIEVPYLTEEEEAQLLTNKTSLAPDWVKRTAKFAEEMRQAFVRKELPVSFSPRRSVAFGKQLAELMDLGFAPPEALGYALKGYVLNATPEEYRQRVIELARAALGNVEV